LGFFQTVAGQIQFQDNAMMDQTINGRRRGYGVLEDALPLGKGQIAGNIITLPRSLRSARISERWEKLKS